MVLTAAVVLGIVIGVLIADPVWRVIDWIREVVSVLAVAAVTAAVVGGLLYAVWTGAGS